jgi:hypothetical protein
MKMVLEATNSSVVLVAWFIWSLAKNICDLTPTMTGKVSRLADFGTRKISFTGCPFWILHAWRTLHALVDPHKNV